MQETYIASAVRTPIGRFGGVFADLSLVAHVMQAALERAGVPGAALDLYVFGNVLRAGHGQLLPRQAALKAGIPDSVDGYAIDMVCSSGMMSVVNAAGSIANGDADLVLAGGFESMSQAGFMLSQRARWGYKFLQGAPEQIIDVLANDGLTDPVNGEAMGAESERLAREYGITRRDLDEWAALSQQRAAHATAHEIFAREIVSVSVKSSKGSQTIDEDEGIRPETTVESLASLRPAFGADGILTAGNSSQISDGAAAVLIASDEAVRRRDLKPLAKILGGT